MPRPMPPTQTGYMPALDGLRAVSIGLVVLAHLGLDHLLPGAFGVTLFFFISGYLITGQLLTSLGRTGRVGLAGFYLRRALRLMPAGLVYIFVSGLLFAAAGGRISAGGWLAALFYGANYYDLFAGYRSVLHGVRHPFNILWSLAIEEHFYALWPLLLSLVWRRRWAFGAVLGLCGVVLLWRWWLFEACFVQGAPAVCGPVNPNPKWLYNRLYMATDTRLDSIVWGALLALAEARGAAWLGVVRRSGWVSLVGLLVLAVGFALPGPFARHVLRGSLQGAALLAVVPGLLARPGRVRAVLSSGPAVLVGRLSYSLYLWHWAALGVADWSFASGSLGWLCVAVPLSPGLAAGSYYGIERPMLRLRRRAGSQALP